MSLYHTKKYRYKYVLKCLEVVSLINVKRRLLMISLHCTVPCDVLMCCVYQPDRLGLAYRQLLSHAARHWHWSYKQVSCSSSNNLVFQIIWWFFRMRKLVYLDLISGAKVTKLLFRVFSTWTIVWHYFGNFWEYRIWWSPTSSKWCYCSLCV